jgi:dTDP-4-dehydrorhamnose 3,5-epimerase
MFSQGEITGVSIRKLTEYHDRRGWLSELYRNDELGDYRAVMAYLSATLPGVTRGPHEHVEQTDYFCFLGTFTLYLWDNRRDSPTYGKKVVIENADRMIAVVPPGVVHAYRNSGDAEGIVLNFPDRLYAGWGKKEKVDEVRHEHDPASPFRVDG